MYTVSLAKSEIELDLIVQLRYKILRKPWSQSIESATDNLEANSYNAFITDKSGNIIACARLQENENKIGQIRFMAVEQNYQGQGLGKQIVAFLENQASLLHLQKIELQARENAVEFYRACGYSIKEKSFLLWGEIQHFLMEKKL